MVLLVTKRLEHYDTEAYSCQDYKRTRSKIPKNKTVSNGLVLATLQVEVFVVLGGVGNSGHLATLLALGLDEVLE